MQNDDKKDDKKIDPAHAHAWRGTWNRPMQIDERSLHPFTVARMTDHNVRGSDDLDIPALEKEDVEAAKSEPSSLKTQLQAKLGKKAA